MNCHYKDCCVFKSCVRFAFLAVAYSELSDDVIYILLCMSLLMNIYSQYQMPYSRATTIVHEAVAFG